jgi:aqualysin 1
VEHITATNTFSGTSEAAPPVAGVAALILEGKPAASPAAVRTAIVNGATKNVVKDLSPISPNLLLFSGATL